MKLRLSIRCTLLIIMVATLQSRMVIAQNNENFSVSSAATPAPRPDELTYLDNVIKYMNGVEGFHPVSIFPGCAAKQTLLCSADPGRNWYPVSNRTQIACGTLIAFSTNDDRSTCQGEMDWNIDIRLSPLFSDLGRIGNVIKPITAEVTPDESFFNNRWFPKDAHQSILQGQNICVCGPHVRDEHHNDGREIHPAQVIWWDEGGPAPNVRNHHLLVMQNDNRMFDDNGDFGCGGGDSLPAGFVPWGRAPIAATFKIAFLIFPPASPFAAGLFSPMRIKISDLFKRLVVTSGRPESADADNGTQHILEYDGKKLIIVDETQTNDDDIGVQFVEIRKRSNGVVQGYVQISTVVGRNDVSDKGGYHLITAEVTPAVSGPVGPRPDTNAIAESCEPEKTTLANLRKSLKEKQDELLRLRSAFAKASAQQRPIIQLEINEAQAAERELLQQAGKAEQRLRQCLSGPQKRSAR